jgi:hypothetical protein
MKRQSLGIVFILSLLLYKCNSSGNQDEKLEIAQTAWTTLFDGISTHAFRGYDLTKFPEGIWYVENGVLVANPDTTNCDLITKERFGDFELEYEWAVDTGANSGVFFHVQELKPMESGNGNSPNWLENWEIQILDDMHFPDTATVRSAGSLYDLIKPTNKILEPIGEFNKARLIVNNGHVEHWLNGNLVLQFNPESDEMKKILSNSKFKDNPNFGKDKEGHIMFQHHGQRVYFRNIRVRDL